MWLTISMNRIEGAIARLPACAKWAIQLILVRSIREQCQPCFPRSVAIHCSAKRPLASEHHRRVTSNELRCVNLKRRSRPLDKRDPGLPTRAQLPGSVYPSTPGSISESAEGNGEKCSEIHVMGEDNVAMLARPRHHLRIWRIYLPNVPPMRAMK